MASPPEPLGSAHRMLAPYQAIRCADGYITLAGGTDRLFERLCTVLGHPEWTTEPAFANDTLRVRNRVTLIERIEAMTTQQPRAHWLARFDEAGMPCGPINDYQQTFADPQVRARGMVVDVEHPTLGPLRTLGSPIKMSATPPVTGRRAPLLGEHTARGAARAGVWRARDQRGDGRRRPGGLAHTSSQRGRDTD